MGIESAALESEQAIMLAGQFKRNKTRERPLASFRQSKTHKQSDVILTFKPPSGNRGEQTVAAMCSVDRSDLRRDHSVHSLFGVALFHGIKRFCVPL